MERYLFQYINLQTLCDLRGLGSIEHITLEVAGGGRVGVSIERILLDVAGGGHAGGSTERIMLGV
jgi:hypothetical protein